MDRVSEERLERIIELSEADMFADWTRVEDAEAVTSALRELQQRRLAGREGERQKVCASCGGKGSRDHVVEQVIESSDQCPTCDGEGFVPCIVGTHTVHAGVGEEPCPDCSKERP